jgi:hypothetical protein
MGQRAAVVACWRKRPDCGGLPPWSASVRLSGRKDQDQKAERTVVHALAPPVAGRPGKLPRPSRPWPARPRISDPGPRQRLWPINSALCSGSWSFHARDITGVDSEAPIPSAPG